MLFFSETKSQKLISSRRSFLQLSSLITIGSFLQLIPKTTKAFGGFGLMRQGAILPNTPSLSSPTASATNISLNPTLTTSIYSVPAGVATHAATQWQIATVNTFASGLIVDTGDDSVNKTSYNIITALSLNTTYYVRMRFKSSSGQYSLWSATSNFTTVVSVIGEAVYTTPGTYSWSCPAGVTSVSVVVVGTGSTGNENSFSYGGAGGALSYKNNISVTPGTNYTVVVGAVNANQGGAGGDSSAFSIVSGGGNAGGTTGGIKSALADGGCNGSPGNAPGMYGGNGGGGAGGYDTTHGGGGYGGNAGAGDPYVLGGNGGGASLYGGKGGDGAGYSGSYGGASGGPGQPGFTASNPGWAGGYGAGGASGSYGTGAHSNGCAGAVRIIWGAGRSFPSSAT